MVFSGNAKFARAAGRACSRVGHQDIGGGFGVEHLSVVVDKYHFEQFVGRDPCHRCLGSRLCAVCVFRLRR